MLMAGWKGGRDKGEGGQREKGEGSRGGKVGEVRNKVKGEHRTALVYPRPYSAVATYSGTLNSEELDGGVEAEVSPTGLVEGGAVEGGVVEGRSVGGLVGGGGVVDFATTVFGLVAVVGVVGGRGTSVTGIVGTAGVLGITVTGVVVEPTGTSGEGGVFEICGPAVFTSASSRSVSSGLTLINCSSWSKPSTASPTVQLEREQLKDGRSWT